MKKPRQQDVPQVNIASREHITRFQIDSVLSIMGNATMALGQFIRISPESDKFTPVDSEAKISLENTVRAACERMDKILEEDARWNMDFQRTVEQQFADAQKLQMEVLADQRAAAKEVTSPHFRYRPTLVRLVDGSWVAMLGDFDTGVIGAGNNPADAIAAFDDAFRGVTNEKVLLWAKERETNLENGEECKPFPTLNNENQKLDGLRNQNPQDPPQHGEDNEGNRGGA